MYDCIIGIDQSTNNTGVTVALDKVPLLVTNIPFDGCKSHTEYRNRVRGELFDILKEYARDQPKCIIERIRLQSKGFISINYIKSISALDAVIVDTMAKFGIPVYSVDTRAWKAAVVGTSKPQNNPYGIPPEKFPTIQFCVKNGWKRYITYEVTGKRKRGVIEKKNKRYAYDDDRADSICIALYGFLPENKQKLQKEQ